MQSQQLHHHTEQAAIIAICLAAQVDTILHLAYQHAIGSNTQEHTDTLCTLYVHTHRKGVTLHWCQYVEEHMMGSHALIEASRLCSPQVICTHCLKAAEGMPSEGHGGS